MIDKIYLVKIDFKSYDNWFIEKACSTIEKAESIKDDINSNIERIKDEYFNIYNIGYDEQLKMLEDDDYIFSEEYEKTIERIFEFKFKNPELDYNNITIVEEKLY